MDDSSCVPIANGLVHKLRSDSTVNTAADSTDDTALGPTDLPDPGDFLADELFLGLTVR